LFDIREKIPTGQCEFSNHAVDPTVVCGIAVTEMGQTILTLGHVIEDNPKPTDACACERVEPRLRVIAR
jgi:hypothetical protein